MIALALFLQTSAAVFLSKEQSTFAKASLWHSFVLAGIRERLNKSSLTAFCVEGTSRSTGAKTLEKQLKGHGYNHTQLKAYIMILFAGVKAFKHTIAYCSFSLEGLKKQQRSYKT